MIKQQQIQLRGISRTPSDRMTSDGGCAESLNVHLDEQELAPSLAPRDVTAEMGVPEGEQRPVVYIHKGDGYSNLILFEDGYHIGAYVRGAFVHLAFIDLDEEYVCASSVGNSLIVMTDKHSHYFLFKDSEYIYLGNKIKVPTIRITPEAVKENPHVAGQVLHLSQDRIHTAQAQSTPDHYMSKTAHAIDIDEWNTAAAAAEAQGEPYEGPQLGTDGVVETPETFLSIMKANIETLQQNAKNLKCFVNQMFAMAAIRLYNGTYITSVPVLLPGGFESPFEFMYVRETDASLDSYITNREYFNSLARFPYRIKVQLLDFGSDEIERWKDIIHSISFFITPYIPYDVSGEKHVYIERQIRKASDDGTYAHSCAVEMRPCSERFASGYIDRVLAASDYRLIESVELYEPKTLDIQRLSELRQGTLLNTNAYVAGRGEGEEYISGQDLLLTQPALSDYQYETRNPEKVAACMSTINNRLLLSGVTEMASNGSHVFPAAPCVIPAEDFEYVHIHELKHENSHFPYPDYPWSNRASDQRWQYDFAFPNEDDITAKIVYHIRGTQKDLTVQGRIDVENNDYVTVEEISVDKRKGYFGFLLYPDARCYSVDVICGFTQGGQRKWYKKTYEMRPHPYFPWAYAYIGVDRNLLWDVIGASIEYNQETAVPSTQVVVDPEREDSGSDVNEVLDDFIGNKVFLSDADNPWFFPTENIYTMTAGQVVGTAIATRPMSQGQFGQFPLYVFTDNGVYAMQMSSDGTFVSANAISRDVALAGTITPIDQAVVFVTKRGVMAISGAEIVNLSKYMNGRHFMLDTQSAEYQLLFRDSRWNWALPMISDNTTFMGYMENATGHYDYVGERIIFYNAIAPYAYVYMIKTQSWHKISMLSNNNRVLTQLRFLNSYPNLTACSMEFRYESRVVITAIVEGHKQDLIDRLVEHGVYTAEEAAAAVEDLPIEFFITNDVLGSFVEGLDEICTFMVIPVQHPMRICRILDYSTVLNDADVLSDTVSPVKGVIITRPFDLGESDVRKALVSLRIRGRFNRNDVKYILLGSFDGLNWKMLTSLRGGSYKWFRLIILADLSPTERISWVDIEYDSRFANKLR